jgi:sugar lactone lactonase YvrE
MAQPEHVLSVQNELGETPIWEPEEGALYWVDWGHKTVHRFVPSSGAHRTFEVAVESPLTAIARREGGGWVVVAQREISGWDPASGEVERIVGPPEPDQPALCFNDAAVDRQGRLLVGTVDMEDVFAPNGGLYRVDADGSLHKLAAGFATANGLGVSPDGEAVYVTDMRHHKLLAYAYDLVAGEVSRRRLLARVPEEQGMPDGLIVDGQGFVWSGHWAGWRLTRYAPDGAVERQVGFPVEHIISFAFGGDDLDELYVTTAWYGFDVHKRNDQPLAGDLFRLKTDVPGLVEPAFKG